MNTNILGRKYTEAVRLKQQKMPIKGIWKKKKKQDVLLSYAEHTEYLFALEKNGKQMSNHGVYLMDAL